MQCHFPCMVHALAPALNLHGPQPGMHYSMIRGVKLQELLQADQVQHAVRFTGAHSACVDQDHVNSPPASSQAPATDSRLHNTTAAFSVRCWSMGSAGFAPCLAAKQVDMNRPAPHLALPSIVCACLQHECGCAACTLHGPTMPPPPHSCAA